MPTARIEKPFNWPTICLVGAIALGLSSCASSDAETRKAAALKADTTQQQKPVKLRYYGGPKYPMYPE